MERPTTYDLHLRPRKRKCNEPVQLSRHLPAPHESVHPKVASQRPNRMAEGRGTVFLDSVMPDPGQAVAEDNGREKKLRPPLYRGSADAQDGRARSGKV